jgi:hypothetical protein
MSQRTTIGWSFFSSGIVALLLTFLPYPSWLWGIALLIIGAAIMVYR